MQEKKKENTEQNNLAGEIHRGPRFLSDSPLIQGSLMASGTVYTFLLSGPWKKQVWLPIPLRSIMVSWKPKMDVKVKNTNTSQGVLCYITTRVRVLRGGMQSRPGVPGDSLMRRQSRDSPSLDSRQEAQQPQRKGIRRCGVFSIKSQSQGIWSDKGRGKILIWEIWPESAFSDPGGRGSGQRQNPISQESTWGWWSGVGSSVCLTLEILSHCLSSLMKVIGFQPPHLENSVILWLNARHEFVNLCCE